MSKDPAFLFYPGDWLGGTMGMTFEEKGAYMDLLMLQFNRGHMTEHMMGQVVGQLLVKLLIKFEKDDYGLYYNKRLELEIEKRKAFIQSRLNNITGKNQYSKKEGHMNPHMNPHMTFHMENENEDISLKGVQGENIKYITPKLFDDFWKIYPKKVDKGKALTSWNKICTRQNKKPPTWKEIKIALHYQKLSDRWKEKKYIPHPSTWLNESRWLDDPKEMKSFNRDEEKFKCWLPKRIFGKSFSDNAGCCQCEERYLELYTQCRLANSKL